MSDIKNTLEEFEDCIDVLEESDQDEEDSSEFFYEIFGDEQDQNDWTTIWKEMPEHSNKNKKPHRSILIHFASEKDLTQFIVKLGYSITNKTKFLWYPPKEKYDLISKWFVDESELEKENANF